MQSGWIRFFNLMLLSDGLRQCRQCGKGPLSLDDLSKPPTRIGLGVVLQMKCRDCEKGPGGGGVLPIMAYTGRLRPKGVPFCLVSS